MTKRSYHEGDIFLIELAKDKYRLGLVARRSKQGPIVLGYFHRQTFTAPPQVTGIDFNIEDFIPLILGDQYLVNHKWTVIGQLNPWDRSAWPMPEFVRTDPVRKVSRLVIYDDDNLLTEIRTKPCTSDPSGYPRDALFDAKAVETYLNRR